MTLPANRNPLPPPPITGQRTFDSWARELYRAIGGASDSALLRSENITGILASANAAPNLVKNTTNDATADSIDAGSDATVRIYGPGGVGSNWTRYRNGVAIASHAAVTFIGKSYATRYYIGFNTLIGSWLISTSYKDVTGDYMVVFSVLTVSAGGAGGASGGGSGGSGGTGGVGGGGFSGYGFIL